MIQQRLSPDLGYVFIRRNMIHNNRSFNRSLREERHSRGNGRIDKVFDGGYKSPLSISLIQDIVLIEICGLTLISSQNVTITAYKHSHLSTNFHHFLRHNLYTPTTSVGQQGFYGLSGFTAVALSRSFLQLSHLTMSNIFEDDVLSDKVDHERHLGQQLLL